MSSPEAEQETQPPTQDRSLLTGTSIVLILIIGTLIWYLAADRYTPYTQQARVKAFVVGVAPKVAGVITKVWVKNDQYVTQGSPLFQIDRQPYEIALLRAQADLENARSQLQAAQSTIEGARAKLASALANEEKARKDAIRQESLHKKDPGAISVRRVEIAQATFKDAQARVAGQRAELQKALDNRKGVEQSLQAAKSALDKARLDLDNTLVRASSEGVITDLAADVGRYAGTGTPVMTLVAIHNVWIEVQFTENNLGHLEKGTPVEFVLDVFPGRVFAGRVRSIGLGVSTGNPPQPGSLPSIENNRDWLRQAQRFPVEIQFDTNQDGLDAEKLRVGGQAEVIAYSEDASLLRTMGKLFIRFMSWLSYAY
ncbi:HlyD family secretion protein [Thiolapillus brandeum]|uniref:Secretion protein HlyD family protein n=1 Tax=Thiolapillus brandeum TaxID=1076588 RepID=A0A7U6JIA4_9GAMM|nr:HlyD family secretion protein [Thiolapillus brandeum]BAO44035.1 secretion protein HlyD family protein [Thiolapillus brandeum]